MILPSKEYWRSSILVSKNGKQGVIDFHNNILLPIEYKDVDLHGFSHEGIIEVSNGSGSFFVNRQNQKVSNLIFEAVYEYRYMLSRKFIIAQKFGQSAEVYDTKGNVIIPHTKIGNHANYVEDHGVFIIQNKKGKYHLYNLKGKIISQGYNRLRSSYMDDIRSQKDKRYIWATKRNCRCDNGKRSRRV